jgi:hypothetical protein
LIWALDEVSGQLHTQWVKNVVHLEGWEQMWCLSVSFATALMYFQLCALYAMIFQSAGGIFTLQQVFCSEILFYRNGRPSVLVRNVQLSAFHTPRDAKVGCLYLVVIRIHTRRQHCGIAHGMLQASRHGTRRSPRCIGTQLLMELHRETNANWLK